MRTGGVGDLGGATGGSGDGFTGGGGSLDGFTGGGGSLDGFTGGGGSLDGCTGGGGSLGGFTGGGGSVATAIPPGASGAKRGAQVAWDPTVTGAACARLRRGALAARAAARALRAAPDLRVPAAAGATAGALAACAAEVDDRAAALVALADRIDELADRAALVGRAYEQASDAVLAAVEGLAGTGGWLLGRGAAVGAALGVGALLGAGLPVLVVAGALLPVIAWLASAHPEALARLAQHGGRSVEALREEVDALLAQASPMLDVLGERLLATPAGAAVLRAGVESADEMVAGWLGVPLPVVRGLEHAVGEDELLALLAGGGAIAARGGLEVGGVRASLRPRDAARPPEPVTDAAGAMRVIRSQEDQVVIHELRLADGSRHFQVFVDGTQDFGLSPETGLDGLANLENGAGDLAPGLGSAGAVAEAMREAGIGAGDTVDLFGYSQGGHIAATIAASQEFEVRTVLAVGAPVDGVDVPAGVDALGLAHEGDLVPATQGSADEPGAAGVAWDLAHGRDPLGARGIETATLAPAARIGEGTWGRHDGDEYLATLPGAAEQSVQLAQLTARVEGRLDGAVGVATTSVRLRRDGVEAPPEPRRPVPPAATAARP